MTATQRVMDHLREHGLANLDPRTREILASLVRDDINWVLTDVIDAGRLMTAEEFSAIEGELEAARRVLVELETGDVRAGPAGILPGDAPR